MTQRAKVTIGRGSTKIVGGPMSGKNVGHHGWPTDKILVFEWPKTAQMVVFEIFVLFPEHFKICSGFFLFVKTNFVNLISFYIFKFVQDFPCSPKQFL